VVAPATFVPAGTEGMEMKPIDTVGGRETNTIYGIIAKTLGL
jgi:hypothetical protein